MSAVDLFRNKLGEVRRGNLSPEAFFGSFWPQIAWMRTDDAAVILEEAKQQFDGTDPRFTLWNNHSESVIAVFRADFVKAIEISSATMEGFVEIGEPEGQVMPCMTMLLSYRSLGSLDKALEYLEKALDIVPKLSKESIYHYFASVTYYQAGEIYFQLKNFDRALELYETGLRESDAENEFQTRLLNGMGNVYMVKGDWEKALHYLEEALLVAQTEKSPLQVSKCTGDLGIYYFRKGDFQKARTYYEESMSVRLANKLRNPVITNYIQLAELAETEGNSADAIRFATLAVDEAGALNIQVKLIEAHLILSRIFEAQGDIQQAFHHYRQYTECKERVLNQEVHRQEEQLNSRHKIDLMQQEKEIFRLRNVELKSALQEISESITYARRIQHAILPPVQRYAEVSDDFFLIYQPKDIVAGDFYWLEQSQDRTYFAVGDCTGHGVPGAMVSVVCHNALNRAVREYQLTNPGAVLDKTTDLVIEQFEKSEEDVKDGMDIALCTLEGNRLRFAGANNSLWLIRSGELMEYKAMKQPIGIYSGRQSFETHEIALLSNDLIILFSDGYADQFGGEKGKKFSTRRLKETILGLAHLPMSEVGEQLKKTFTDWKGELEQLDDVCLLGFRF